MKRIAVAIMLSTLLLTIAGCKNNDIENVASTSTSASNVTVDTTTQETENTITPIKQIPMISVTMPVVKHSTTADDNTVIFNHIYQNMVLITQDPEVADKVIIDFLNQTDMENSAVSIQKQAEIDYEGPIKNTDWYPYLSQLTYRPTRIDQGIISLFGSYVSYTGGAHSDKVGQSLTYDLVTGHQLSLKDIFAESVNSEYICNLVLQALSSKDGLYKDYEAIVKTRFNDAFWDDDDWYFTNTGLCFFFSTYEIASYASGTITAEIPYDALIDVIKNEYFPSERENARGAIEISQFNENSLRQFTQFSEVVLEEGTDKILLHSENGVYDVRIEYGSWSADGKTFTPEYTVFASYALTPTDAIMVEFPLSESLPNLRLSYTSDEETVSYFITASNGTVTLNPS